LIVTPLDTVASVTFRKYWPDTLPAVLENIALEKPAATVTDCGICNALGLFVHRASVTGCKATSLKVTVHAALLLKTRLLGLHCRDKSAGGATKVREVESVLPPAVAVIIAV
jgi:hypothetical protein